MGKLIQIIMNVARKYKIKRCPASRDEASPGQFAGGQLGSGKKVVLVTRTITSTKKDLREQTEVPPR